LAIVSSVLTVSLLIEEEVNTASRVPFPLRTDEEIRKAVLAAIAAILSDRPDVRVEWESLSIVPLDGKPSVGRCVVCNRWVYDMENITDMTPTRISRGAVVDGQYLCDEHLPEDHPAAF